MTKFTMLLAAAAIVAPAMASAQVGGVAVANPDQAVGASRAWTTARGQIETTYKAQITQAQTRGQAIQAELRPLVAQFETAQKAPGANPAALQTQFNAIKARQAAGEQELAQITSPANRAQQYAIEQISNRLPEAVQNVVKSRNVSLLLRPDAAIFAQPAADITSAITTELDRLVPSVGITPPAGWQPGQQQQGGAAAGTAPAAPTATPTTARPTRSSGR